MAETRLDLRDPRWEVWSAATGIAFVVVAVIAFLIVPNPPKPGDSSDEILTFFVRKDTRLLWQAFLFGLSGVFFLWFVGTVAAALRRAEGDPADRLPSIAVASGAATAGLFLGGLTAWTSLASAADEGLGTGAARALFELGNVGITMSDFAAATFAAAVALGILRTAMLPAWAGWLGFAVFVLGIVAPAGRFPGNNDAFGAGGSVSVAYFLAFFAWSAVVSAFLTRRSAAAS